MKIITFKEPHHLDPSICIEVVMTEEDVLDHYWEHWKDRMTKANKTELITESNCIEDFIIVNWAVECEDYDLGVAEHGVVRMDWQMYKDYLKRMKDHE